MSAEAKRSLRLFFALWPDEALRARLAELVSDLRFDIRGKWVKADNLHITLAFLGDVDTERLPAIREIADGTTGAAFDLTLDRVEFWPRNGIVCLSPASTPQTLRCLAEDMAERLRRAEFVLDTRPYRAHLTLARKGSAAQTLRFLPKSLVWKVATFCLVESCLGRGGSTYVVRQTWCLKDPESVPGNRSVR